MYPLPLMKISNNVQGGDIKASPLLFKDECRTAYSHIT